METDKFYGWGLLFFGKNEFGTLNEWVLVEILQLPTSFKETTKNN